MPRPSRSRSSEKVVRQFLRLGIGVFVCLLSLVALIWGGHAGFLRLQEYRLIRRAHVAIDKHDDHAAAIAAQRAFAVNPRNIEACRILGEILDREHSDAALDWRREAFKLRPDSLDDAVALATTALRLGEVETARQALDRLPAAAGRRALFHETRGHIALAENNRVAAAGEFEEALRLEPANRSVQLSLAVLRVAGRSAAESEEASQRLRTFLDDPSLRKTAARALRDAALEQRDGRGAFEYARTLATFPEADFADRLAYLQMLRQLNHPDYPIRLLDAETEAASDVAKSYALISWLRATGQPSLALNWSKEIPVSIATTSTVAGAIAECYGAVADWTGLQRWCQAGDWRELDFLRHANLCRAFRAQLHSLEAEREWNLARKGAASDARKKHSLQQTAAQWGWKSESLELLWELAGDPAQRTAALDSLFGYYAEEHDTANLYRVVLHISEIRPDDPDVENNLAQLGLLLGLEKKQALQLARKAHAQNPANPIYASTLGYALYVDGQIAQALESFNSMKEEELRAPGIAVYYGLVLAAAGDKEKAREFLPIAANASLFPEERELLARANATVAE